MADDRSAFIKQAIPAMLLFRDRITYDPKALNGLPMNVTTGGGPPADTPRISAAQLPKPASCAMTVRASSSCR